MVGSRDPLEFRPSRRHLELFWFVSIHGCYTPDPFDKPATSSNEAKRNCTKVVERQCSKESMVLHRPSKLFPLICCPPWVIALFIDLQSLANDLPRLSDRRHRIFPVVRQLPVPGEADVVEGICQVHDPVHVLIDSSRYLSAHDLVHLARYQVQRSGVPFSHWD